jgi:hypothetical protein
MTVVLLIVLVQWIDVSIYAGNLIDNEGFDQLTDAQEINGLVLRFVYHRA